MWFQLSSLPDMVISILISASNHLWGTQDIGTNYKTVSLWPLKKKKDEWPEYIIDHEFWKEAWEVCKNPSWMENSL